TIKNDADASIEFKLEDADLKNIVFPDVPKGQYTMTVTWEDGLTSTLKMKLTVGPKTVISEFTEEEQSEEEKTPDGTDGSGEGGEAEDNGSGESGGRGTESLSGGGYETASAPRISSLSVALGTTREVVLIPRKREYNF
ncbi:MAG: hypothetical protein IJS67_00410, partial [Clostridia bacterium]|nr:hypothetical protein [Clostridia bacterium]